MRSFVIVLVFASFLSMALTIPVPEAEVWPEVNERQELDYPLPFPENEGENEDQNPCDHVCVTSPCPC